MTNKFKFCELAFRLFLFGIAVMFAAYLNLHWMSFFCGGAWALFIFSFPPKH